MIKKLFAILIFGICSISNAQDIPNDLHGKTITLIIPYGPGGNADLNGRDMSNKLSKSTGINWVVMNKTGGNASIGADYVANSKPDGLTLCQCDSGAVHVNTIFNNKNGLLEQHKFQPIATLSENYWAIIARYDAQYNSFNEFMTYVKINSSKLNYAVTGPMSIMWAEKLFKFEQISGATAVLYKSEKDGLADVLGNHIEFMITGLGASTPLIEAKKLKIVVLGSDKEQLKYPQVPIIKSKYPMSMRNLHGLYGPLGIRNDILIWLNKVYTEALLDQALRNSVTARGNELNTGDLAHAWKIDQMYWNDRKALVKEFGHVLNR